jgi:hypothetical protein
MMRRCALRVMLPVRFAHVMDAATEPSRLFGAIVAGVPEPD